MSDVDYVGQIQGLIDTTMKRFNKYKSDVSGVNTELNKLLLKLQQCIERLYELLTRYDDILSESRGLQERLQMAMEDVEGQKRACKDKLEQIYSLFNNAVEKLGEDDVELQELKRLSNNLKTEIDKICADIDRRMTEGSERSGAERLRTEEKEETRSEETKSPSPSPSVRDRITQIESRNVRGGWRSPNELKSIPYGTPVRSVNIKYNKTKNKNKKKKKKKGTRKKKKKQSRRKRRKGRKGKRN